MDKYDITEYFAKASPDADEYFDRHCWMLLQQLSVCKVDLKIWLALSILNLIFYANTVIV